MLGSNDDANNMVLSELPSSPVAGILLVKCRFTGNGAGNLNFIIFYHSHIFLLFTWRRALRVSDRQALLAQSRT